LCRRYRSIMPVEGLFHVGCHKHYCDKSGRSPIAGTRYHLQQPLFPATGTALREEDICEAVFNDLPLKLQSLWVAVPPDTLIDIDLHNAVKVIVNSNVCADQCEALRQVRMVCDVEATCAVVVTWQLATPLVHFIEQCEDASWASGGIRLGPAKSQRHADGHQRIAIMCALQLFVKLEPWMLVRLAPWLISCLARASWHEAHLQATAVAILKPLGSALTQCAPELWKLLGQNPVESCYGNMTARESAVHLLGLCSSNYLSQHIPVIMRYLQDDDETICRRAVALLCCTEPRTFASHAPQVLEFLTARMMNENSPFCCIPHEDSPDTWVRQAAWTIRLLMHTDDATLKQHARSVQRLVEGLQDYHSQHSATTHNTHLSRFLCFPLYSETYRPVYQIFDHHPFMSTRMCMPFDQPYEEVETWLVDVAEVARRAKCGVMDTADSSNASGGSKRARDEDDQTLKHSN